MSKTIQHPIQQNKILGFIRFLNGIKKLFTVRTTLRTFKRTGFNRFLNGIKKPFSMRTALRTNLLRTFKMLGFVRFLTPTQHHNKQITVASCECPSYPNHALSKISKLALAGYNLQGVQPTLISGFFVRNISMRSHVMAKLERDILGCAGNLVDQSANPFQLCHHYLAVIGKAPKSNKGAH